MSENSSVGNSESGKSICSEDFEGLLEDASSSSSDKVPDSSVHHSTVEIQSIVDETVVKDSVECVHPGFFAGMCVRCGVIKEKESVIGTESSLSSSLVPLRYVHKNLELSEHEAQRLSEESSAKTESQGKLQLVLDLDHTLLNSAPLSTVVSHPVLDHWIEAEIHGSKQTIFRMQSFSGITKLRPGVFEFLTVLSEIYEMHIYTMGEEQYANAMAELLDPTGRLFHGKVISRNHSSTPMMKSLDVVMGADRMTVIVDDTWQVWHQHSENLIQISKYLFFPPSPNEGPLSLGERCWLELMADECSITGPLSQVKDLLRRIHSDYFSNPVSSTRRDVRSILQSLQARKRQRV
eukprot:g5948.t1